MDKESTIYKRALTEANRVYGTGSSIYRSGYIVQQYKKMGGMMRSPQKTSPKKGLQRWFREEWIQVIPYLKHKKVVPCGRSPGTNRRLPACRPLYRITEETPITIPELVVLHGKKKLLQLAEKKERSPSKRMNWRSPKRSPKRSPQRSPQRSPKRSH